MARKAATPVNTQMGSQIPSSGGCAHVGPHKPVIHVSIGEGRGSAMPAPGQTAGNNTRPAREGTKQFPYGKNST